MKKRTLKLGAALLSAAMMAMMATGCSKSSETAVTTEAATKAETTESTAAETTEAPIESSAEEDADADSAQLPKVGIAWVDDLTGDDITEDVQAYINSVIKAGGEPVMLPRVENEEEAMKALEEVGAIIMTGGEDISPTYYGEEPDEKLEEINEARDTSDFWMITAALKKDMPMLATCRGEQMLNAVCGGTLYQDIPTQYETETEHRDPKKEDFTYHDITIDDGNLLSDLVGAGTLKVNSWHHQCIKDLGENLKVVATSGDGIIEAVVKEDSTYVLAVQFHPEYHVEDGEEEFLSFFTKLVELAAK